jgi:hypothetical protein
VASSETGKWRKRVPRLDGNADLEEACSSMMGDMKVACATFHSHRLKVASSLRCEVAFAPLLTVLRRFYVESY